MGIFNTEVTEDGTQSSQRTAKRREQITLRTQEFTEKKEESKSTVRSDCATEFAEKRSPRPRHTLRAWGTRQEKNEEWPI
jgi:hypothetical protein